MKKKPYSDSRWYENPMMVDSQCNSCQHYHGFGKCDAFPDGIPEEILDNQIPHDRSYPGDQGLQYMRKETKNGLESSL